MFAMPHEISLTGKQGAKILEKVAEAGCTECQVKCAMKALSFAYQLVSGKMSSNWAEVTNTWHTLGPFAAPTRQSKPVRIPQPEHLKSAWTKNWTKECGLPLYEWCVGNLVAWDWTVCGMRTTVDLTKIKHSRDHDINPGEGYSSTALFEGRAKLCGNKRGTRPWRCWRLCMCKDGKHISPPDDIEYEFDKEGNLTTGEPSWNTCCPVACQQVVTKLHKGRPVRLYSKWGKKRKQPCKDSHPKPTKLANRWFEAQGIQSAPFDTNAGRKSLAKWCSIGEEEEVDVPYHESFQIHGDLFKVWRGSYQPSCRNPAGFKGREQ